MSTTDKLSPSLLITLGLTGAISAVAQCGPCLKYAPEEDEVIATATPDTGDEPAPGERAEATRRVLARGVLPEDVAALVRAQADRRDAPI